MGGDAALAGARVLRSVAGPASGGRVRRVRGGGVQAVLRAADGRAVAAAGAVFPHAHDRLLRGHRQRAGHRVALRGLVLAARFPAAVEPREGSRSFLAVAHALASAARGARDGVRLGAEARGRARPGEGRADRRRRLDDGGQRRAAHDRAARQRRELSRDADADGARERRSKRRRPRIWRASTASARARRCRTPTGRARPTRTPGSPR